MDFNLLRRRTAEVDEQHRAAMATIDDDLRALHFSDDPERVASRRRFLRRATGTVLAVGAVSVPLGGVLTGAAAQDDDEAVNDDAVADGELGRWCDAEEPLDLDDDDVALVAFAESVERAAAAFYTEAVDSLPLPAAVAESARLFARHHTEHGDALNCLIGGEQRDADPGLVDALVPQLVGIETEALVELFYELEESAAATYYVAIGEFDEARAAGAASRILPVEAQHAVVWAEQLGMDLEDYVPTFQGAEGALEPGADAAAAGEDETDTDDDAAEEES
ncbi:MAG: ferritin-like domain-containing protein [Acidimicrobiia bacterium]|nr:ferritin-like domain-containing protein [Acidimicrobiia bacterium]